VLSRAAQPFWLACKYLSRVATRSGFSPGQTTTSAVCGTAMNLNIAPRDASGAAVERIASG
jgi:hypothetical protein